LSVESIGEGVSEIRLGEEVLVSAKVTLHPFSPEDVEVQVLAGLVDADGNLKDPIVIPMRLSEHDAAGNYLFQTVVQPSATSGSHGYAIRLLPKHADSVSPFPPSLIKWAQVWSPVAELQAR
jgi:glycogen phosphorylase